MIFQGYFNKIQICFTKDNLFQENKQIIIKNARSCDEDNNKFVPARIPLKEAELKQQDIEKINNMFQHHDKKKQRSKMRKTLA